MKEKERFDVIETLDFDEPHIKLEINRRMVVPFTGGEITYATTLSGEKFVIKKPINDEQAKHEWKGLNIAYSAGISTPRPIALINYNEDQLGIVSGFVEGKNLHFHSDPEVKVKVGEQFRVMHQKARTDGNIWESSGRSSFSYYDELIFNWSREGIEELKFDGEDIVILKELAHTTEEFCRKSVPTFNHNDLHDGQIIVNREGEPTIMDFGNWTEETWINDIAYHLFHLIRNSKEKTDDFINFLSGYHKKEKLSDIEKTNLAFYLLFISSRALAYFYNRHSRYLPVAQKTHEKVLDYLKKETIWKNY